MATVNLSFDVPAAHVGPLRAFLDLRHGDALDGMTDEQALEFHVVQATVPGYNRWRRANDTAVTTAKAALESNDAARAVARHADEDTLAGAEAAAGAVTNGGMAGLS